MIRLSIVVEALQYFSINEKSNSYKTNLWMIVVTNIYILLNDNHELLSYFSAQNKSVSIKLFLFCIDPFPED